MAKQDFSKLNFPKKMSEESEKKVFLEDEELKVIYEGLTLTNEQIIALNSIPSLSYYKGLIGAIRALQERNNSTDLKRNAGRKKKQLPVSKEVLKMRHDMGERYEDIARSYNMSRGTLYNLIKE